METKRKHTFMLKNIDIETVHRKYNISTPSTQIEYDIPSQTTVIEELDMAKINIPFMDNSKKHCITMIDSISCGTIKADTCFWCRHTFSTVPIGCPLQYYSNTCTRQFSSEITKDTYTIQQKMTQVCDMKTDDTNVHYTYNDYYETDGAFCSFNCCLAFIHDQNSNPIYNQSEFLLLKMYMEIFKRPTESILPAPSWRLLQKYGGFMTIDEFRQSFNKYVYIPQEYKITDLPRMKPIGYVYEEHYIF